MDAGELLAAGLVMDAGGVDAGLGAFQRAAHGGFITDIGLDNLDLTDVAHQAHGVGQMRLADGHANAQALLGEGPNDLGSDEA